ncbi:hypothetical protein [Gracilimonas amylolytica]|uniref:hypothetical protein n=1 Tax=Gracilimonas amylolytica TaxID=1749045 RepID=UPI000CD990EB|nr:hypothetical protein [Gracilimonas amylolytica]
MKKALKITGTILLIICTTTAIFAQSSDYEITKEFETSYGELKASIDNATSVEEADSLNNEVIKLRESFAEHKSLLDHALYPNTFDDSMQDLLAEANETEEILMIIDNQGDMLTSLNKQLEAYQKEISLLNNETDSLKTLIAKSEESEQNLSRLVKQYRQRVEERDEFVLNMMDSLFVAYRELDLDAGTSKEITSSAIAIQQGDNPLEFIEATIEENIQVLKAGSSELSTQDLLKMHTIQKRFAETWDRVGSDLSQVYGGNEANQWRNKIDDQLKDWKASTSKNTWDSINQTLAQNNVDLGAFDNNQSFYSAIENFINNSIENSEDKIIAEADREEFNSFYEFWNSKVKEEWGNYVQEGEILTMSQISTIDAELINWRDETEPVSLVIPILLGLSFITIVGLIIVLARKD